MPKTRDKYPLLCKMRALYFENRGAHWVTLRHCDDVGCMYGIDGKCDSYSEVAAEWIADNTVSEASPQEEDEEANDDFSPFKKNDVIECISSSLVYSHIRQGEMYMVEVEENRAGQIYVYGFNFPVSASNFRHASSRKTRKYLKKMRKQLNNRVAQNRARQAAARTTGAVVVSNPVVVVPASGVIQRRPVHAGCYRGKDVGGRS